MPELRDPTRETLSKVVRALVKRHGGPTAVGDRVGAHRLTVNRWMKGDIGLDKLGLLAEVLGEPVTVSFGPTNEETAEPEWVRRIEDRLVELRANQEKVARAAARGVVSALSTPELMAWQERIASALAELPTPDDEAPGGPPGTAAPGEASTADRERG